jgi:hypothetical protein
MHVLGASQQRLWLPGNGAARRPPTREPCLAIGGSLFPFADHSALAEPQACYAVSQSTRRKNKILQWLFRSLAIVAQPVLLSRNQSALSIPGRYLRHSRQHCPCLPAMASSGTMRGTPKGRGTVPAFSNSPASNIPRPAFESHPSASQSEAGGSTMSASRQKQSKRDEVCLAQLLSPVPGHN